MNASFAHAARPPVGGHRIEGLVSSAEATAFRLDESIHVTYEIGATGADGSQWQVQVHVDFPEEARALLAALSWSQAERIVDTVLTLGASYVGYFLAEQGRAGLTDSPAAPAHLALTMPFGYFREELAASRSQSSYGPGAARRSA